MGGSREIQKLSEGWGSEKIEYRGCLDKNDVAKNKKGGIAYPN